MDPAPASAFPTGETAAVAASTLWAVASLFFAVVARRVGAWAMNQYRLFAATALLGLALVGTGLAGGFAPFPPGRQTALLLASGVVGLTLGDGALFRAFVILGARRVAILTALAPVFVALLAAPLLSERIGLAGAAGMGVTLAGIFWVILDRAPGEEPHGSRTEGVVMGVLAALGQAGGAVLTKAGLGLASPDSPLGALAVAEGVAPASVDPLTAVLLRMAVGAAALALWTVPTGRVREIRVIWADRRTFGFATAAMVLGTFCGVWLSLVAFAHTETAIAQTLLSLTPVLILPVARAFTSDRPPLRAWVGAFVAVVGVALIAFRHRLGG